MGALVNILGFTLVLLSFADASPTPQNWNIISDKCQKQLAADGFCTEPHNNATSQLIDNLLEQYKVMLGDIYEHFNQRVGDDVSQNDCKKTSYYDPIYEIYDQTGQTRAVVQSGKQFMQILKIEKCVSTGPLKSPTSHFKKITLRNNLLECQQQSMDWTFLVLNLEGTGFERVKSMYQIPVHCACVYVGKKRRRN